jgi:histone deacetylase 11
MIVDLDAHQGNGHERDRVNGAFGDLDIYILDMYNSGIYPGDGHAKQGIDKDVLLRFHTNDQTYLDKLHVALREALDAHNPQFIVYNAGTDCLIGDPLGALNITREGIIARDEFVFRSAFDRRVPIAMLLSGGYQKNNAQVIADSIQNLNRKFDLFDAVLAQSQQQRPAVDAPPAASKM